MSTRADAPSVSGEAFAAVTEPYFLSKTGLSPASFSVVESVRGMLSCSIVSVYFGANGYGITS